MHCFWILIHVCINSFCVYVFGFSPEVLPLQWYLQVFIISGCHFCYACDSVRHCTLGLYYSYPHTIYIYIFWILLLSSSYFPLLISISCHYVPIGLLYHLNVHSTWICMLIVSICYMHWLFFVLPCIFPLIMCLYWFLFLLIMHLFFILLVCIFLLGANLLLVVFFTLNVWPGFYFILLLV